MPIRHVFVACLLAAVHGASSASPGDVFVPAHRTRDGSFVPPNVAPMSGGSHLARRPARRFVEAGWRRGEVSRPVQSASAGGRPTR